MLLSASNIIKYHNDKCILNNVSFSIEEQDKIALVGVNGTGKSTFLNIVAGKEEAEGKMIRKNGLRISYLSQNPSFDEENSILEQVYVSCQGKVEEFEMKAALNTLGINEYDEKIKHLSGGQKKRVALAVAMLDECDLLILDEPTNHLDYEMIEYLEKFLKRYTKAVLMVTHDRYFLDRITNRIFEIDRCQLYEYKANYSQFLELKMQREENALAQERKRESFLKKELEWVRAGVQARGTKSRDRLERFQELSSIEKIETQKSVDTISVHSRLGKKTIEIENISMGYDKRLLFDEFSYHFKRFERVGIIGTNGSGKSTLLDLIAQKIKPLTGQIIYGDTIRIGYYEQTNASMDEDMRVIDYIKETSDALETSQGTFSAKVMLERFLFNDQLQYAKIKTLSGGEKRRLYLLKVLMSAPNVLLMDEPTNDLDIDTLQILEDYLDSFQGIVVVVSHDRYFLDRICDSMLVFTGGEIQKHIGGYSASMQIKKEDEKVKGDGAKRYQQFKQEQKAKRPYLSSADKRELETMEETIASIENEIAEIDEMMAASVSDFEKLDALSKQRTQLEVKMEEKSERWMYLLEVDEQIKAMKKR